MMKHLTKCANTLVELLQEGANESRGACANVEMSKSPSVTNIENTCEIGDHPP